MILRTQDKVELVSLGTIIIIISL